MTTLKQIAQFAENNNSTAVIWASFPPNKTKDEIVQTLVDDKILLKNTQDYIKNMPGGNEPTEFEQAVLQGKEALEALEALNAHLRRGLAEQIAARLGTRQPQHQRQQDEYQNVQNRQIPPERYVNLISWIENLKDNTFTIKSYGSYVYYTRDTSNESIPTILDYSYTDKEDKKRTLAKKLVGEYKIHLMPKNENDLYEIVKMLASQLKENQEFANKLLGFKFKYNLDFDKPIEQQLTNSKNEAMPIVVIYPRWDKQNAQFVLDSVYNLFKDMPGLGIKPRYNEKINNLIYYAQGAGDHKSDYLAQYYKPDRHFYKSNFEGDEFDKDYRLKNPTEH